VGIGLRTPHYADIVNTFAGPDWFEFVPENFVGRGGPAIETLRHAKERWPLIPHGVSVGVGGKDPFDETYLAGLKRLLDELECPYYSDHLCFVSAGGSSFFDLLPMPRTHEAIRHVGTRVRELADRLERPVVLENISYYAVMPGSEMDEHTWIASVLEEADCGLLLDLANIYVNSKNHGLDPMAILEGLPLERVAHVHLAGHFDEGTRLIDDHGAPVPEPVWSLYERLLERVGPVSTLIEWDTKIPAYARVLAEAEQARARLRGEEA
jgi:uncharacterized protein (UPF0276 family)